MRDHGFNHNEAYVGALTGTMWMFVVHMILTKSSIDFAYPWKGVPGQRPTPCREDSMFSITDQYAIHSGDSAVSANLQNSEYQVYSAGDKFMAMPCSDLIVTVGFITAALMLSAHFGIPVGIDLSSGSSALDEVDYFDNWKATDSGCNGDSVSVTTLKDGVPVSKAISVDSTKSDDSTVVHSNQKKVRIYHPRPDIAVTVSEP